MNKKFARFGLTALLVFVMALMIAGIALADTELNIPLNNDTAQEGLDCPATGGPYWHFVISPNNGHSYFITFHLNLGDATTYDTTIFVPNGSQLDNVFVAVPSGKTLTSLIKEGSSADISWDGTGNAPDKFQLSHVCSGNVQDLAVSKTAEASYTRTFEWTIDKSADTDTVYSAGGDESGVVNFTVAVTKSDPLDSDFVVSGTITVHNPNSFAVNGVSVSDSTPGGDCTVTPASVDVAANSDATADYECTFASNPGSGTNTATATWPDIGSPNTSDDGTADYTFGDPTTVVNDEIDVTDTNGGAWHFAESGSVSYEQTYTDPAGTCTEHTNTATIDQTGAADSATVEDCQGADLVVTKDATPSYDLTYAWTIDKAVVGSDSATVDQGQPATFNYTVTVSHDAGTQSNWVVSGTITVSNPNDWQDIVADVSDSIPGGTCSVTGGTQVTVPASDSVTLDYSCSFASNPGSGTNTATATWDAAAAHTPNGSDSGDAAFNFADATVNAVNDCITVVDDKATPGNISDDVTLGTVCVGDANPTVFNYSLTLTGPAAGTCVDYTNKSTFTTNDTGTTGSDSATVHVCSFKAALTPGYWKTHLALNGTAGCTGLPSGTGCSSNGPFTKTYLPKSVGAYNVDTILKAAQIWAVMNCSSSGSNATQNQNAMGCLAGHLLAAKLNVANGANTCIAPVIAKADQFLTNPPLSSVTFGAYTANSINYTGPSGSYTGISTAQRNLAIALKNALDAYDNGTGCH